MSGLNPLAALAAQNALTQAQIQAIDLGVAVEILQQQLTVGDLLTATVLPSQGGVDFLQLFGTSVVAQLPPGVNPGQSLLLQVTGFANNQILVQNLGIVDPENPPQTATVVLPDADPPQQAVVTTYLPAQTPPPQATAQSQSAAPQTPAPAAPQGSVAPPIAVFVAASVQPSAALRAAALAEELAAALPEPEDAGSAAPPGAPPGAPLAAPGGAPAPAAGSSAPAPPAASAAPPAASGVAPQATVRTGALPIEVEAGAVEQLGLEARIAATRAASVDIAGLVRTPARGPQPPAAPLAGTPARATTPIAPPLVGARPQPAAPPPVAASARPLVPPSPEAALLERLRVPLSALALGAAKVATAAGTVLPRALARLETVLAGVAQQDGRAASLRTLLSFAGRLDPGNARALPEQLAAFVNNFVAGSEGKLATMIRAFLESSAAAAQEEPAPAALPGAPPDARALDTPSLAPPSQQSPPGPAPQAVAPQAAVPQAAAPASAGSAIDPNVAARVAERAVALQYDAKAVIASMLEAPARGVTPELTAALSDALTAITGMQLNVLNAQNANPNAITIPLPVFFRENGLPVQLQIDRDAPGAQTMDGDNFSIAFVLDTKSLGTVAIDVQTVGRTVSVNVKTEGVPAASRFRSTLGDLRGRLEQLRYNVANMTAAVAARRTPEPDAPAPAPETAPEDRVSSVVDMQA